MKRLFLVSLALMLVTGSASVRSRSNSPSIPETETVTAFATQYPDAVPPWECVVQEFDEESLKMTVETQLLTATSEPTSTPSMLLPTMDATESFHHQDKIAAIKELSLLQSGTFTATEQSMIQGLRTWLGCWNARDLYSMWAHTTGPAILTSHPSRTMGEFLESLHYQETVVAVGSHIGQTEDQAYFRIVEIIAVAAVSETAESIFIVETFGSGQVEASLYFLTSYDMVFEGDLWKVNGGQTICRFDPTTLCSDD